MARRTKRVTGGGPLHNHDELFTFFVLKLSTQDDTAAEGEPTTKTLNL